MKTPYEPPILRTHRLITGSGTCQVPAPKPCPVETIATSLQTLAIKARNAPSNLHTAPSRQEFEKRLRDAGQQARAMRA